MRKSFLMADSKSHHSNNISHKVKKQYIDSHTKESPTNIFFWWLGFLILWILMIGIWDFLWTWLFMTIASIVSALWRYWSNLPIRAIIIIVIILWRLLVAILHLLIQWGMTVFAMGMLYLGNKLFSLIPLIWYKTWQGILIWFAVLHTIWWLFYVRSDETITNKTLMSVWKILVLVFIIAAILDVNRIKNWHATES